MTTRVNQSTSIAERRIQPEWLFQEFLDRVCAAAVQIKDKKGRQRVAKQLTREFEDTFGITVLGKRVDITKESKETQERIFSRIGFLTEITQSDSLNEALVTCRARAADKLYKLILDVGCLDVTGVSYDDLIAFIHDTVGAQLDRGVPIRILGLGCAA